MTRASATVFPSLDEFVKVQPRGRLGASSRRGLPGTSGVYVLVGHQGQPVYIGMSSNLNARVRQHWYPHASVLYFETDESSARFIEMCLIAQHNPEYNTLLRTSRTVGRPDRKFPDSGLTKTA